MPAACRQTCAPMLPRWRWKPWHSKDNRSRSFGVTTATARPAADLVQPAHVWTVACSTERRHVTVSGCCLAQRRFDLLLSFAPIRNQQGSLRREAAGAGSRYQAVQVGQQRTMRVLTSRRPASSSRSCCAKSPGSAASFSSAVARSASDQSLGIDPLLHDLATTNCVSRCCGRCYGLGSQL